jgi:hypothetical protein
MRTLHLNLKKKWFDLISSGEKTEEYRVIKKYWVDRLLVLTDEKFPADEFPMDEMCFDLKNPGKRHRGVEDLFNYFGVESTMHYDTITFRNGFKKNAPEVVVEFKGFEFRGGIEKWGAVQGESYFVLLIGKIIK